MVAIPFVAFPRTWANPPSSHLYAIMLVIIFMLTVPNPESDTVGSIPIAERAISTCAVDSGVPYPKSSFTAPLSHVTAFFTAASTFASVT